MNYKLKLFIDNEWEEVQLSNSFSFAFNYTLKDFSNPSDIKTGYSKTITFDGSPYNNSLLQNIYKNGANYTIVVPNKKIEAQLTYNGTLITYGYIVINSIQRNFASISYNCTFYDYTTKLLYDMKYNSDGTIKTLADLDWTDEIQNFDDEYEYDLKYTLDSWSGLEPLYSPMTDIPYNENNDLHKLLVPIFGYTGLYENFDSNKVLVCHQTADGEPLRSKTLSDHYMVKTDNSLDGKFDPYNKISGYNEHFIVDEDGNELPTSFYDKTNEAYTDYHGWYCYELSRNVHPMEARTILTNRLPLGLNMKSAWKTILKNFGIITVEDGWDKKMDDILENMYMIIQNNSDLQKRTSYDANIQNIMYFPNHNNPLIGNNSLLTLQKESLVNYIDFQKKIGDTMPYAEEKTMTFDVNKDCTIHIAMNTAMSFDKSYNVSQFSLYNGYEEKADVKDKNVANLYYQQGTRYGVKTVPISEYYMYLNTKIYMVYSYDGDDISGKNPVSCTIIPVIGDKETIYGITQGSTSIQRVQGDFIINYIDTYITDIITNSLGEYNLPENVNYNLKYLYTGFASVNQSSNTFLSDKVDYYLPIQENTYSSKRVTVQVKYLGLTFFIPYIAGIAVQYKGQYDFRYGCFHNQAPLLEKHNFTIGEKWYGSGRTIKVLRESIGKNSVVSVMTSQGGIAELTKPLYLQGNYLVYHFGRNVEDRGLIYTESKLSVQFTQYSGTEEFQTRTVSKNCLKTVPVLEFFLNICKLFNLRLDTFKAYKPILYNFNNWFLDLRKLNAADIDSNIDILPSVIDKKAYNYKLANGGSYADELQTNSNVNYGQTKIATNIETSEEESNVMDSITLKTLSFYNLSSVFMNGPQNRFIPNKIFNVTNKGVSVKQSLYKVAQNSAIESIKTIENPGLLTIGNDAIINPAANDSQDRLCLFNKDLKDINFIGSIVCYTKPFLMESRAESGDYVLLTEDLPITFQLNEKYCYPMYVRRNLPTTEDAKVLIDAEANIKAKVNDVFFESYTLPAFSNYTFDSKNHEFIMTAMSNLDNGMFRFPLPLPITNLYEEYFRNFNSVMMNSNFKKITCNIRFQTKNLGDIVRHVYQFDNAYWVVNKVNNFDIEKEFQNVEMVQVDKGILEL